MLIVDLVARVVACGDPNGITGTSCCALEYAGCALIECQRTISSCTGPRLEGSKEDVPLELPFRGLREGLSAGISGKGNPPGTCLSDALSGMV